MCQGLIQASPARYSARCGSVHVTDEVRWGPGTGQDHPSGWGRCWQDGLSCSCWAAIQGDRQSAVYDGVETDNRWRLSNSGWGSGRSASIWERGVPASRWATAMGNSIRGFHNASKRAASRKSIRRSQHPSKFRLLGRGQRKQSRVPGLEDRQVLKTSCRPSTGRSGIASTQPLAPRRG